MLAQLGSIGCRIEITKIPDNNSASIFNTIEQYPSATYSMALKIFYELRNILTALNGGVRMPGARAGREPQKCCSPALIKPSLGIQPSRHSSQAPRGET
mgnify:CR=1 FL=1